VRVTQSFRRSDDRAQAARRHSYLYLRQHEEADAWVPLQPHGADSLKASHALAMFAGIDPEDPHASEAFGTSYGGGGTSAHPAAVALGADGVKLEPGTEAAAAAAAAAAGATKREGAGPVWQAPEGTVVDVAPCSAVPGVSGVQAAGAGTGAPVRPEEYLKALTLAGDRDGAAGAEGSGDGGSAAAGQTVTSNIHLSVSSGIVRMAQASLGNVPTGFPIGTRLGATGDYRNPPLFPKVKPIAMGIGAPKHPLPFEQLAAFPLAVQVEEALRRGGAVRFLDLNTLLGPLAEQQQQQGRTRTPQAGDAAAAPRPFPQELLDHCGRQGRLIRGVWVVKSELAFDHHWTARFANLLQGVKAVAGGATAGGAAAAVGVGAGAGAHLAFLHNTDEATMGAAITLLGGGQRTVPGSSGAAGGAHRLSAVPHGQGLRPAVRQRLVAARDLLLCMFDASRLVSIDQLISITGVTRPLAFAMLQPLSYCVDARKGLWAFKETEVDIEFCRLFRAVADKCKRWRMRREAHLLAMYAGVAAPAAAAAAPERRPRRGSHASGDDSMGVDERDAEDDEDEDARMDDAEEQKRSIAAHDAGTVQALLSRLQGTAAAAAAATAASAAQGRRGSAGAPGSTAAGSAALGAAGARPGAAATGVAGGVAGGAYSSEPLPAPDRSEVGMRLRMGLSRAATSGFLELLLSAIREHGIVSRKLLAAKIRAAKDEPFMAEVVQAACTECPSPSFNGSIETLALEQWRTIGGIIDAFLSDKAVIFPDPPASKKHRYVLDSQGGGLDRYRWVIFRLLADKQVVKKPDVFAAVRASLGGEELTQQAYTRVMREVAVSQGLLWKLKDD
jgi:hypothetical protein